MELYLEATYGTKQLEIVSEFAWKHKLNMTIDWPSAQSKGFVVADETKSPHSDFEYIEIDRFNTYEELSEYIATIIIGG